MSAAVILPTETQAAAPGVRRKRFTRQEVDRLTELGVFEGQRYELIDGDLIDKMGRKPPHARAIRRLIAELSKFIVAGLLHVQSPIDVSGADSEKNLPEPDVAVLAEDKPDFDQRLPKADELLLVIEVSDTSAGFDLSTKAVLYAKAVVREYWVLDLVQRRLIAHRQPDGAVYRLIQVFAEADTVTIEGRSEPIRVGDLLPAAQD